MELHWYSSGFHQFVNRVLVYIFIFVNSYSVHVVKFKNVKIIH